MNRLKIGQSFEVAEILPNDGVYDSIYQPGNTGAVIELFNNGNASICVGESSPPSFDGWFVKKEHYKIVGKLTVKTLKN